MTEQTPQSELLNKFCDILEEELNVSISKDELPDAGGIYAELGTGSTDTMYYSKQSIKTYPILVLCKDRDQLKCLNTLSSICNYISVIKEYPKAEIFQWLDAVTATEPNKIGKTEDGKYIYSCIVNCKIHY